MSRTAAFATVSVVLFACHRSPPREDPDYGTTKTDTVPQFYGRVPQNILMISMDTFRTDHLDRAPFLSAMAEQGFVASDTTQCSNWTYASTSCTLLGRYNEQAGMLPALVAEFDGRWPVGTPFLASWLGEAGYYNIIASTNGWFGPEWGNTGGADEAFHPTESTTWGAYFEARDRLDFQMRDNGVDRWMIHLHVTEPHASYNPPAPYLEGLADLEPVPWDLSDREEQYSVGRQDWPTMTEEERALLKQHLEVRYSAEIAYMDDQIWRIIAAMDFDGLLDDTLVVFWTDHGEAFWEHDVQTHAYTLYREENDALLFMWAKNIVPQVWDGPVTTIDLVPTLLALQGLPQPPEVTGLPIGTAPDDRPRFANAVARLGPISSVTMSGKKLVFSWSGQVTLFDHTTDPGELVDLYDPAAPSDDAVALWAELMPRVVEQQAVVPQFTVSWPAELPQP